jgi:hypothetical protein
MRSPYQHQQQLIVGVERGAIPRLPRSTELVLVDHATTKIITAF